MADPSEDPILQQVGQVRGLIRSLEEQGDQYESLQISLSRLGVPSKTIEAEIVAVYNNIQQTARSVQTNIQDLRDNNRQPEGFRYKAQLSFLERSFRTAMLDFGMRETRFRREAEQEEQRRRRIAYGDNEAFETSEQLLQRDIGIEVHQALRNERRTHEDLIAIEQDISELSDLFTQVEASILSQGHQVNKVQACAESTTQDFDLGVRELDGAIGSATSHRRNKKLALWIGLGVIVLGTVVAVGVFFGTRKGLQ